MAERLALLHVEPSDAALAAIGARRDDGPFVALNLNRYRERAAYPDSALTGGDAA
jgi:hypothetical protein